MRRATRSSSSRWEECSAWLQARGGCTFDVRHPQENLPGPPAPAGSAGLCRRVVLTRPCAQVRAGEVGQRCAARERAAEAEGRVGERLGGRARVGRCAACPCSRPDTSPLERTRPPGSFQAAGRQASVCSLRRALGGVSGARAADGVGRGGRGRAPGPAAEPGLQPGGDAGGRAWAALHCGRRGQGRARGRARGRRAAAGVAGRLAVRAAGAP